MPVEWLSMGMVLLHALSGSRVSAPAGAEVQPLAPAGAVGERNRQVGGGNPALLSGALVRIRPIVDVCVSVEWLSMGMVLYHAFNGSRALQG